MKKWGAKSNLLRVKIMLIVNEIIFVCYFSIVFNISAEHKSFIKKTQKPLARHDSIISF